jgi:hypothetical protein
LPLSISAYVLSVVGNVNDKGLVTSVDTIKSCENKRRNPTGLAAKVLAAIQDNPNHFHNLSAH